MTTLSEQIVARPVGYALAPDVETRSTLSGRVGRGTERHAIDVTVWNATPEREHPLPGYPAIKARPRRWNGARTYCGSQRFGSGVSAYSLTAPVTCERCLRDGSLLTITDPADLFEVGSRGDIRLK